MDKLNTSHEHHNNQSGQHTTQSDNILQTLKESKESMQHDIVFLSKLANTYYGTKEDGETNEYLYTIIKYLQQDTVVQVAEGDFTEETFTDKENPETRPYRHSPLPLFVVSKRVAPEEKQSPKQFLNEHTVMYSPKGGEVHENDDQNIDYKHTLILHYPQAICALQNKLIDKEFRGQEHEKFVNTMKMLKKQSLKEFSDRMGIKDSYYNTSESGQHELALLRKIQSCLKQCVAVPSNEHIYHLVQSYNLHNEQFEIHNP